MKPRFLADNLAALDEVAAATGRCAAVVGFVELDWRGGRGRAGPATAAGPAARRLWPTPPRSVPAGRSSATYHKRLLPNYGVFDEQRWFVPGDGPYALYDIAGAAVGVSICEDVWSPTGRWSTLGRGGADLVVNINASPFSHGRWGERLDDAAASGSAEAGARSPTAIWSAARTSWSSTGRAWSSARDGDAGGRRPPVRRGPGGGGPRSSTAQRSRSVGSRSSPVTEPRRRPGRPARSAPDRPRRRSPRAPRSTRPSCSGPGTTCQERLHRRRDRAVRRHRLGAGGHHRRRRARRRARARALDAVALLEQGSVSRRRASSPTASASTSRWSRSSRPTAVAGRSCSTRCSAPSPRG